MSLDGRFRLPPIDFEKEKEKRKRMAKRKNQTFNRPVRRPLSETRHQPIGNYRPAPPNNNNGRRKMEHYGTKHPERDEFITDQQGMYPDQQKIYLGVISARIWDNFYHFCKDIVDNYFIISSNTQEDISGDQLKILKQNQLSLNAIWKDETFCLNEIIPKIMENIHNENLVEKIIKYRQQLMDNIVYIKKNYNSPLNDSIVEFFNKQWELLINHGERLDPDLNRELLIIDLETKLPVLDRDLYLKLDNMFVRTYFNYLLLIFGKANQDTYIESSPPDLSNGWDQSLINEYTNLYEKKLVSPPPEKNKRSGNPRNSRFGVPQGMTGKNSYNLKF